MVPSVRCSMLLLIAASMCSGCGFFSDRNSDQAHAAARAPSAQTSSAKATASQDYSTFTPEQWLNLSLDYYKEAKYVETIGAAQTALYLRPDYAEAYNNMAAAFGALHLWDPAIQASQQALKLKPDLQLARNNLAWSMEQKRLGVK